MRRIGYALVLPVVVVVLAIAGCGSSGGSESGGSNGAAKSEAASSGTNRYGGGKEGGAGGGAGSAAAVVSLGSVQKLGMVLVDSQGMTLYDFHKDRGGRPSCYGGCAQAWPPLTTAGGPQAGNGASSAMLGTVERSDGTTQVTYAGHPLYTFVEDTKPGEANGNDVNAFGAQWYALKGNGEEAGD